MGLAFSNSGVQWAYSGFNNFRRKLAKEIGMNLDEMYGFGGNKEWDGWVDDIIPLLNHSDCDGELIPEECKLISPRLKELVNNWDDNDIDKIKALDFADDLWECYLNNEPMEFR